MTTIIFAWLLLSLLLSWGACACRRREDRDETRWLDALRSGAAADGSAP